MIRSLEKVIAGNFPEGEIELKIKVRVSFLQNSEGSKSFPTINELKNLWSVLADCKQEIAEKIEEKARNRLGFRSKFGTRF